MVLALQAGSRGFNSHRGHMSKRFFRSNRRGYLHPVSPELENSGIRVAVSDCSVTERRRWRPPYQTGKTVHVHAKHYKHNQDGRTAPGVGAAMFHTAEPLGERRYENWNTHTHDAITANLIGRTHPYRGYGCVPLRFGGASLGEWEHNKNDAITRCQTWISITHMVACAELQYKKSNFMPVIIHSP